MKSPARVIAAGAFRGANFPEVCRLLDEENLAPATGARISAFGLGRTAEWAADEQRKYQRPGLRPLAPHRAPPCHLNRLAMASASSIVNVPWIMISPPVIGPMMTGDVRMRSPTATCITLRTLRPVISPKRAAAAGASLMRTTG